jgi:hypothetical protein
MSISRGRWSSFVGFDSENDYALFQLPSGFLKEMTPDEAAAMDTPEGTVVVTLSATMFKRLLDERRDA